MLSDNFCAFMETKNGLKKLEGFSEFNFNAGVQSYIRKYFSMKDKSVDVTGMRPVISYTFDRMKNNIIHDYFAEISDSGLIGDVAYRNFVFVDLSEKTDGKYNAFKQCFEVISADRRPENGFLDYSGKLMAKKDGEKGYFISDENSGSGEFIPERSGILCD